jgi:hypothetical protein
MSDDPEFSRRSFLRGLGAAMAASAAPKDVIDAAAAAVGRTPHPLAMEYATNIGQLHEPYYSRFPNDFRDLRAEAIRYLTDNAEDLGKDPEMFGDEMRATRDAIRLLESGWTPPARLLPDRWTRTAEDHDAAPEEPHQASAVQQVSIGQQGEPNAVSIPAVVERANEDLDLAANPDPVGVSIRFPDGGISVHLGDGEWQDIDRTPGAFTAVRLWPHHSNGVEDYRLYDHAGTQVPQADVAIVGNRAHIANIEAEGGAHALGIKALRTPGAKLQEEFPELVGVTGLRSSGAGPGRTQEVEFRNAPNEGDPLSGVPANTKTYHHDFDGDDQLSRHDLLKGLGAAAAASVMPEKAIKATVKTIGEDLHPLAREYATNVWQLKEYFWDLDLRAEAIQYLTDLVEDLGRVTRTLYPDSFKETVHAYRDSARLLEAGFSPSTNFLPETPETQAIEDRSYRDAARLLESGWTPPARASTAERDTARTPPPYEQTSPGAQREVVRTVTLAEHVDELRAELRGSLDSRERETIAAELDAAHVALKEQEHDIGSTLRPDIAPNQIGGGDAKKRLDDIGTAVARLTAETGLPYTPAVEGEFVAGTYRESLTLTSGRFAMIDNGLGFALVPWTPELDRHLGRHVVGVAHESGGIEWSFGRKRGLEI